MHLAAEEKDKRLIAMAAVASRLRLGRGAKPNVARGFRIGGPLGG